MSALSVKPTISVIVGKSTGMGQTPIVTKVPLEPFDAMNRLRMDERRRYHGSSGASSWCVCGVAVPRSVQMLCDKSPQRINMGGISPTEDHSHTQIALPPPQALVDLYAASRNWVGRSAVIFICMKLYGRRTVPRTMDYPAGRSTAAHQQLFCKPDSGLATAGCRAARTMGPASVQSDAVAKTSGFCGDMV